jgi:hypothetical protein
MFPAFLIKSSDQITKLVVGWLRQDKFFELANKEAVSQETTLISCVPD